MGFNHILYLMFASGLTTILLVVGLVVEDQNNGFHEVKSYFTRFLFVELNQR